MTDRRWPFDQYAYLDFDALDEEIDRGEEARAEWEPEVSDLVDEGYANPTEVESERGARRKLHRRDL